MQKRLVWILYRWWDRQWCLQVRGHVSLHIKCSVSFYFCLVDKEFSTSTSCNVYGFLSVPTKCGAAAPLQSCNMCHWAKKKGKKKKILFKCFVDQWQFSRERRHRDDLNCIVLWSIAERKRFGGVARDKLLQFDRVECIVCPYPAIQSGDVIHYLESCCWKTTRWARRKLLWRTFLGKKKRIDWRSPF